MQKLFFTDFHQNDIRPDFFNTTERNHIFSVTAKYPADLPGNRNDDRQNLSIADINIHIHHTAKSSAVTYIDYFFLSQFTEAINDAVEEAKNEMGVEFVEDVDKDAFREATKGMIEDYCERYPGVAELLDIIESVK